MTKRLKFSLLSVVFLLGYTNLSFELIVLRQLINFVGSNTLITSIVMTFVLLFLSMGYYLGSVTSFKHLALRRLNLKFLKLLILAYIVACTYPLITLYFMLANWAGIRSALGFTTVFGMFFLAIPALMLGFITSVIGRIIHRAQPDYTGRFMAIDTLGSVAGSLVSTLVIMPFWGVCATIILLTVLTALAVIFLSQKQHLLENILQVAVLIAFAIVVNKHSLFFAETRLVQDNAVSRIELQEADFDENQKAKSLIMHINGSMSSKISQDENLMFDYIRYINKTFVASLPQDTPRDILVLGAGGFTIGLKDSFHRYVFLDIEKDLKNISEREFLKKPLTPNKTFVAQDAYDYLLRTKEKFDLIVVDVYAAVQSIPLNFTTVDFFELVQKHLKPAGIMVANIITAPNFSTAFSRRIDNTLRFVFRQYLDRHVLQDFKAYGQTLTNVVYAYYNLVPDHNIYKLDQNAALYGQ